MLAWDLGSLQNHICIVASITGLQSAAIAHIKLACEGEGQASKLLMESASVSISIPMYSTR